MHDLIDPSIQFDSNPIQRATQQCMHCRALFWRTLHFAWVRKQCATPLQAVPRGIRRNTIRCLRKLGTDQDKRIRYVKSKSRIDARKKRSKCVSSAMYGKRSVIQSVNR